MGASPLDAMTTGGAFNADLNVGFVRAGASAVNEVQRAARFAARTYPAWTRWCRDLPLAMHKPGTLRTGKGPQVHDPEGPASWGEEAAKTADVVESCPTFHCAGNRGPLGICDARNQMGHVLISRSASSEV